MKDSWLKTLVGVVVGLSVLGGIWGFSQKEQVLVSPFSGSIKSLGENLWFPKNHISDIRDQNPEIRRISAKAAFFVNTNSGQVLYEKNPHEKLPVASLVKIMTVVLAMEYHSLEDKLTVSKKAADMEPDKMFLIPEEKLTVKELLYGIFMISANDAAEVLAESSTFSHEEFIRLMNDKALLLGMVNTKFVNPTGLDEDNGNSYSSAYDLAILARYAIKKYPEFVEISKTPYQFIPETGEHQSYEMYSGINLLTSYPEVVGFKTGFTPEAGLTLITLARKNGHEVIGVLLGSENRRDEARNLLDYSFNKLGSLK